MPAVWRATPVSQRDLARLAPRAPGPEPEKGSQSGSQRAQSSDDAGRRPASIIPGERSRKGPARSSILPTDRALAVGTDGQVRPPASPSQLYRLTIYRRPIYSSSHAAAGGPFREHLSCRPGSLRAAPERERRAPKARALPGPACRRRRCRALPAPSGISPRQGRPVADGGSALPSADSAIRGRVSQQPTRIGALTTGGQR